LESSPPELVTQLLCVPLADLHVTCAPTAERLLCFPLSRNCNHRFRGLRFHHNSIRSPIAVTAASILPSLSKSAKTAPRCSRGAANSLPTVSEISANFPLELRKIRLGCGSFASMPPPATKRSNHPSLSKSIKPQPQPLQGLLKGSSPVAAIPSSNAPPPRLRTTSQ